MANLKAILGSITVVSAIIVAAYYVSISSSTTAHRLTKARAQNEVFEDTSPKVGRVHLRSMGAAVRESMPAPASPAASASSTPSLTSPPSRSVEPHTQAPATKTPPPPPDCHANDAEPKLVLAARCTAWELVIENKCKAPYDGAAFAAQHAFAVIARGTPNDMSWVAERLAPVMPYYIYDKAERRVQTEPDKYPAWVTDPRVQNRTIMVPHHHLHRANEGDAYLLYLVEHYDCLPRVSVFLHAHESNMMHQTYQSEPYHHEPYYLEVGKMMPNPNATIPDILSHTCWDKVTGYQALQHVVGNIDWYHPFHNFSFAEWKEWMPDAVTTYAGRDLFYFCCGSFMVNRDAVRARPKEFYIELLRSIANDRPMRENIAYTLEFSWTAMFKVNPVHLKALWEYSKVRRTGKFDAALRAMYPKDFPYPEDVFSC